MSRLHTSFVLGYHGCSAEVGEAVLAGRMGLAASDEKYDWLGPGVDFWEADPVRAWEWADQKVRRGRYADPFVLGAAIDLGNCLDLIARESLLLLEMAYRSLAATIAAADDGRKLPVNRPAGPNDPDLPLRDLDCAVVKHLHEIRENGALPPFDSVRGLFTEDRPLFPGAGFRAKTHVQIAVRSEACLKGLFRVARPPME